MKIDNIIKKALLERGLISEDVNDPNQDKSTRSFNINDPRSVLKAAQAYECWRQWGLKEKPEDRVFNKQYYFSYRGKPLSVQNNEDYLVSGSLVFLGRKADDETDSDDTWFMGFNAGDQFRNLFKGFRWRCNSLKTLDQTSTGNLTPIQQKYLDNFISTEGGTYTKVKGPGARAVDVTGLTYRDGKSIWDESSGTPPKGKVFVYVQETLYNINPDQLKSVGDYIKPDWTLEVPSITDRARYDMGTPLNRQFPELKSRYKLPDNVMIYPSTGSTTPMVSGTNRVDRKSCGDSIKYLTQCMKNPFSSPECKNTKSRMKNVDTATMCYLSLQKEKAKNPTKMLGGIFGSEDELMKLVNISNNEYGIGKRVRELQSGPIQESKKIDQTIKKHLLENIRLKNSLK